MGRTARRSLRKQLLTKSMKKKRLNWARNHAGWTKGDWRKVIFSDKSHFEVHRHKSAVMKRSKGEAIRPEHIQKTPKHPTKKMFWSSFTAKGTGRLIIVEGMMNSDKYKATLQFHLLHVLERDFADGDCIFQQDLAQCHTSKKMRTFFEEKDISILD